MHALDRPHSSDFPRWRMHLTALAAVVSAGSFLCFNGDVPFALGVPMGMLALAAVLAYRDHLPGQVMVRAALWSNLILGTIICASSSNSEQEVALVMALASGVGLLGIGRFGLQAASGRFAPVAFRASLILALVMALADTQSLALFGTLHLEHEDFSSAWPLLACAGLMGVALAGLYRTAVWGLALNIVANLLIATLAFSGVLDLPKPLVIALCTTAVLQLALPLPLLVAMARGKAAEPSMGMSRLRAAVVPATISAMMLLAVVANLLPGRLISM